MGVQADLNALIGGKRGSIIELAGRIAASAELRQKPGAANCERIRTGTGQARIRRGRVEEIARPIGELREQLQKPEDIEKNLLISSSMNKSSCIDVQELKEVLSFALAEAATPKQAPATAI